MKVITRCVLAPDGTTVEEDSYEYHGPVAQCLGGDSGAEQAKAASDQSFELQLKQFKFQKEQAKRLQDLQEGQEAKLAAEQERILSLKRQGQQSTIKTIESRPAFETFKAKFRQENPPGFIDKEKSPSFGNINKQFDELKASGRLPEGFEFNLTRKKDKNEQIDIINKELAAVFERNARIAFEQEKPFERQAFDPNLLVRRKRLTANA